MATFTANPAGSLRVEVESIDVSFLGPERDPAWRYIDMAGHGHFYDNGYPTLTEITETATDPDDGDEYQVHIRWECPHCGEHIVPGTRASMGNTTVPGSKRYYVDEVEVDRDTFLAAWRPLQEQRMAEREAEI